MPPAVRSCAASHVPVVPGQFVEYLGFPIPGCVQFLERYARSDTRLPLLKVMKPL